MNTTKDRMGGFVAAQIISVQDIESFVVENGKVNLVCKTNVLPVYLDIVKNGVESSPQSSTSKSGKIYNIDITIEVKEFIISPFTSFNKYLCILTLPTGEQHVFGTPQFPLTVFAEHIYSKTPSGSTGGRYRITGKQPNNVLILL